MLADFQSKPVQGSLFQKFRSVLMGWTHIGELFQGYKNLEERVGNNVEKTDNDVEDDVTTDDSQARRIANKKSYTYAEAVKKHNDNFMKRINDHVSLKRNNPFLQHLNSLT